MDSSRSSSEKQLFLFFVFYVIAFLFFLCFPNTYYRDLFINFLPYILVLHVPVLILFLIFLYKSRSYRKSCRFFSFVLVISIFFQTILLVSPYYHTSKSFAVSETQQIKVMMANVLKTNQDPTRTIQLVKEEKPDVFSLIEMTPDWIKAFSELNEQYPNRITLPNPQEDGFGMALYSRYPFITKKIRWFPSDIPYFDIQLLVNNHIIRVISIHTMPPITQKLFEIRNQSLEELASLIEPNSSTIVMGDFNLTPWSQYYFDFVRATALRNGRRLSNGLQISWRGYWFSIPIDHIFVSKDISFSRHEIGPEIGSDHLPLIADLVLH